MTNFTICYTVINFESGERERMEKTFISADNTRAYVAMLNKCDDVLCIDVINGMTGEILDEFNVSASKPEPKMAPSKRWEKTPVIALGLSGVMVCHVEIVPISLVAKTLTKQVMKR